MTIATPKQCDALSKSKPTLLNLQPTSNVICTMLSCILMTYMPIIKASPYPVRINALCLFHIITLKSSSITIHQRPLICQIPLQPFTLTSSKKAYAYQRSQWCVPQLHGLRVVSQHLHIDVIFPIYRKRPILNQVLLHSLNIHPKSFFSPQTTKGNGFIGVPVIAKSSSITPLSFNQPCLQANSRLT